ncbi:MAG: fibronectin type III domain-containing protein, partial [Actinomycetota bacterium]|nr:fibronectin type III domain-containing protein [Actinomycetota bacterium]
ALQHAAAIGVPAGSPFGSLDTVRAIPGGVRVGGWAIDPNTTAPIKVALYSDGTYLVTAVASSSRPDVAARYPADGPQHGFNFTARVPEGTHSLCINAVNVGKGANRQLGCVRLALRDSPVGRIDSLVAQAGHVVVQGWTYDPDVPTSSVTTYVSIDGARTEVVADLSRPDVGAYFPAAGANHGFAATLALTQGAHTVCVIAKNLSYGTDATLGCRNLILNDSPISTIAAAQIPGGFTMSGWAYDPNAVTTALSMSLTVDGVQTRFLANTTRNDLAATHPGVGAAHGFALSLKLGQGTHNICLVAVNIGYGNDAYVLCRPVVLNFNPQAAITGLIPTGTGATVSGWTTDPDTNAPIHAHVVVDGVTTADVLAAGSGGAHPGHNFSAALVLTSGKHTVCAVGINVYFGTGDSPNACAAITLVLSPFGSFDGLTRAAGSNNLLVSGWAIDPDTRGPLSMAISVDGIVTFASANANRPDVAGAYPSFGASHGLAATVAASDGEHRVCLTAVNVGAGGNVSLGCKIINAVHPVAPSVPTSVSAVAGFGGATVTWARPTSDGGAPWTSYTVTATPGGISTSVPATAGTAVLVGLAPKTAYTFAVVAINVAGPSSAGVSPSVTTLPAPPPQTTPAPISTSRYIRNITGSSGADQAKLRAEGVADANANPTGHGYLVLLDIGGQDEADGGVVLSATTQFVSYASLVADLNAYTDGYHSAQRPSAPVTLALGTNNDMDVSALNGQVWAKVVVNQVAAHAAPYLGMTVAGANDIEPGFRATYGQTATWMQGYLGATHAPFVFNGSADGCAWTLADRACNNGWAMSGLYYLAAGASPVRILNLPQIYNDIMAAQWKYISLTGVGQNHPKINFGGALTEFTACAQAGGCGSLTGTGAWQQLWNQLQSIAALKVASLPYSTDLRIDR